MNEKSEEKDKLCIAVFNREKFQSYGIFFK